MRFALCVMRKKEKGLLTLRKTHNAKRKTQNEYAIKEQNESDIDRWDNSISWFFIW